MLDVESPGHGELGQPFPNTPVERAGDQDMVARQQGLEDRGGSGAAGGEQDESRPSLERSQEVFGVLVRRIVRPRVGTSGSVGAIRLALVDRRQVDRGNHGP
jgi:hypothetical protein